MKLKLLLILCLISFFTQAQTTIRVTNGQILQTIINNAVAGSTLIVEAGSYGDITVNKRLNFVGTGYFLTSGTQATNISSIIGSVKFLTGSDNSTFTGFSSSSDIYIGANSIIVSKCNVFNIFVGNNGTNAVPNNNNIVKQCYINNYIRIESGSFNFLVKNNIVQYSIYFNSQANGEVSFNTTFSWAYNIDWNSGPTQTAYVTVKNNICYYTSANIQNTSVMYNVLYGNQTGLHSSNKINIPIASVFVSNTNITTLDAKQVLSSTSPAKGAGENGVDCGAFGGDEPYVLSGLPSGPIVYELSVPTQVLPPATLNVRVRARVNN